MSKLEIFALCSGIIGLAADTIALITFFVLGWSMPSPSSDEGSPYLAVLIVMGLVMFYAWVVIVWFLTRYLFIRRGKPEDFQLIKSTSDVSASIGVLLLPLYIVWLLVLAQSSESIADYDSDARFETTRVAQLKLVPTSTTSTQGWRQITPTPIIEKSVPRIMRDNQMNHRANAVFQGILLGGLPAFLLVTMIVSLLMPIIYSDMSDVQK